MIANGKSACEANGHTEPNGHAEPSVKRQKLSSGKSTSSTAIFREDLLSKASCAALRKEFDTSQPYTHLNIQNLCDPDVLRKVREEIINNLQATYKETDLFKVFQTGDLANMDAADPDHAEKLPTLLALRDALYSTPFRQFVRDVTGCGELSDKTDCSCNTYAQGGHLLCHDDVIGTRRVSYIIYLTDPDDPWKEEDGGALELYPVDDSTPPTPLVNPTRNLLPLWNSMAMFTVQPGRSFHAVQEVFTDSNPRLSISGWYHAPGAPEDADNASLKQLQRGGDAAQQYDDFAGSGAASDDLSDADVAYLLKWVNPVYLSEDSWKQVRAKFAEDGCCQLHGFLRSSLAEQILKATVHADDADGLVGSGVVRGYDTGVTQGWSAVGPPHKQRYLQYTGDSDATTTTPCPPGPLLSTIANKLFRSVAFARLLKNLTDIDLLGVRGEVRRFRPGMDYTVAHYGILTKDPRLDCVLCFVDTRESSCTEAWGAGECGGFEAYLLADEEEATAAEVYRQDAGEDSGVLNVSGGFNSLNLVLRDEGLMKFVKYVSSAAPSSRWDISMEYLPREDSDGEEKAEQLPGPSAVQQQQQQQQLQAEGDQGMEEE